MAEGKHTDGPWSHEPQDGGPGNCYVAQVFAADGSVVADIDPRSNDEADANARLIAAAPTLLAERDRLKEINAELLAAAVLALETAESWIHDQLDGTRSLEANLAELEPVRAAIARATVTP